ncbi:MAG: hypothetical protein QXE81_01675 [Desulfurococcaceae archaeon]
MEYIRDCREGEDCDICDVLYSKYIEVVSIIRVLEEKINEIKSSQPSKERLGEILLTSIISVPLFALTTVISKGILIHSLLISAPFLGAVSAAIIRDLGEIKIESDELESIEELLEWFVKLKEAYLLMLKACSEYK